MPARVSTGDRDAVLRQIRWCAAVQTLVNCHCQLDENPVGNFEPVQLVVQYLTVTAIKLPSAGDNTRSSVQHPLARLLAMVLCQSVCICHKSVFYRRGWTS